MDHIADQPTVPERLGQHPDDPVGFSGPTAGDGDVVIGKADGKAVRGVFSFFDENGQRRADEPLRKGSPFGDSNIPHPFSPPLLLRIGDLVGHRCRGCPGPF